MGHPSALGHPEWDTLAADGFSGHPRFHAGGTPSLYTSPGTLPHSFLHLSRPSLPWDTLGFDPSNHPLRPVPSMCLGHGLCDWDTPHQMQPQSNPRNCRVRVSLATSPGTRNCRALTPCGRGPASRAARQPDTGVRRGAGKCPQKGRSRTADMGLRLGAEAPYDTFGADQPSGEATLEWGRLM